MDERIQVITDLLNQILSEIQNYQDIVSIFKTIIQGIDEETLQRLIMGALNSNESLIMNIMKDQNLIKQISSRGSTHKRGRGK